ncbi:transposase [Azospirillum sp. TSO5]|nr:transposase [Azospirillum sp. TSO5]
MALTRKNALFAGSDGGGEHWATIASLAETCKLSGVDPQAWFADVLTKLASGHPITKLHEMLPWAFARQAEPAVA